MNDFSWKELLFGSEELQFLPEVLLRTIIMFIVILVGLVILGKRGVRQLSVFELVVIIGLGSAAGDPMFYKDVGILPALLVFVLIIGLYSIITYWVGRNKKLEVLVEGKPICLVENGRFAIANFEKERLGQDEFFAELRVKGVSQLGQVENAIIETNGSISVFFFETDDTKPGLPIMPDALKNQITVIDKSDIYACVFCGNTEEIKPTNKHTCSVCKKEKWIKASFKKRVS